MAAIRPDLAYGAGAGPNIHAQQLANQLTALMVRRGYFAKDSQAPPLTPDQPMDPGYWGNFFPAMTPPGRSIQLAPNMVRALVDRSSPRSNLAAETLLHELAHSQQSGPALTGGKAEGLAEAFAATTAPSAYSALGRALSQTQQPPPDRTLVPSTPVMPPYNAWYRRQALQALRQTPGMVFGGQFRKSGQGNA